jgi:RNA polymerase sigma-70 factor (ECF subfamily)
MTNHEADQALVSRMLRGDEDAFEMFFDWMFPRVYRFALARVGGREDVAEDITQAAFCQGIRRLETWRGEASLFTWICTICRREVEAWRSAHPGADIHLIEDTPEIRAALEVLRSDEPLAADQMIQREQVATLIQRILDHLPTHYGKALEWKYLDEASVREIAARLDLSEKAAESLLTRARAAFRELVVSIAPDLEPMSRRGSKGVLP